MTAISVVGGIYHERCEWPPWDRVFGSAGRAAIALSSHVDKVELHGYATAGLALLFEPLAKICEVAFHPALSEQAISFEYLHCLSVPRILPAPSRIRQNDPIKVSDEVVLRFGMMEGTAIVRAERCVYDPQSAFEPEPFSANGSAAKHLAIVANRGELAKLGNNHDPITAAQSLAAAGAEVVVVKSGAEGAFVVDVRGVIGRVPAFRSDRAWTIGSGDVFAAIFAAQWGINGAAPMDAAFRASRAVAEYANSRDLPSPLVETLDGALMVEASIVRGRIYLASPFFSMSERWLVTEARGYLTEMGLTVFSPFHDVGAGPAEDVAPKDIEALNECDAVFAIVDGMDSGTLFEIGYARAKGKPVYALAQTVSEDDLKMVRGSGCRIFDDFVTAIFHAAWRT